MLQGGSTAVAVALSKWAGKTISRQQIHTWWTRREHNEFPEGMIEAHYSLTGKKIERRVFRIDDVINWYAVYIPDKGGRPTRQ